MLTTRDILLRIVLPALVALVLFLGAWRPWSRRRPDGRWAGAVAVSVGFAIGFVAVLGVPAFPPADAPHWLLFLCGPVAVLGVLDALVASRTQGPVWLIPRLLVVAALSGVFIYLLLRPLDRSTLDTAGTVIFFASFLVVPLTWLSLELLGDRVSGASLPVVLTLLGASATAVVVVTSGSQTLGQLGAGLAAAVGPAIVVGILARRLMLSRGAVLAFVLVNAGLLLSSFYYAALTPVNGVLVFLGPHLAWVPEGPYVKRARPWVRAVLRVVLVAVPLGVAAALAIAKFLADMAERAAAGY